MTELLSSNFKAQTASLFADNITGNISANDLRVQMDNIADSAAFRITGKLINPTVNDDGADTSGNGIFSVGDIWINETADSAWINTDITATAAVWKDISYSNPGTITGSGAPANNQIGVWTSSTNLEGDSNLLWDGSALTITGNIVVSGTVDGRDIATDGAKLDSIPSGAINGIAVGNENVDGSSVGYSGITTLTVSTGDGLTVSNPSAAEVKLEIANNDVTHDIVNRTLAATDNASFITNTAAAGTVRWTIPTGLVKLVVTLYKTANQTMELIGANTVTINGNTESGGAESLITICESQYTSFVQLVRTGVNTYNVYNGSVDKVGTPVNNQLSVWTGDGTLEGDTKLTWDGSILSVTGEVNSVLVFDDQVGLTYTLAATDNSRIVTMTNAAANVVTIPLNATVPFSIGSHIKIMQTGAGATSLTGAAGVTLNGVSAGTGIITTQWNEVNLYKQATDIWIVTGDIGVVA